MGKKCRAAPGRRPILQLSPPGPRGGGGGGGGGGGPGRDLEAESESEVECEAPAPGPPAAPGEPPSQDEQEVVVEVPKIVVPNPPKPVMTTRPTAVKATGGLCLLGAYADSDDEENEVSEKSTQSTEPNGNQSTDIDSTLANFLAEIDAITAPQPATSVTPSSAPPPTPPRPEPKETATSGVSSATANGTGSVQASGWQYDTQCSLAGVGVEMGDWQEVWDENTGCHYYWNTQSNEVTWELPQYLATQVQGIQHYQHSSVTGTEANFLVTTDVYSKEKAVTVASTKSTTGLVKREVKKEVNEGIQALSNSEEEKKGVAASLLAPLLPDGVKEEEERWRRKVICKEEVEPASEKDAATASEEVATALKPLETTLDNGEEPSQEDLCSVVQSGESEEEEEEQDTLELELVLERKKAELRALEEGDGSVSGSSPRSDISQSASQDGMRRLMSKRGKWKLFVRAASPESTSRGSSKTGRESPENGDVAVGTENSEKVNESSDKELETEESQEKTKAQTVPKTEEQDLKFQIGELANTLTSKLEFLGISRQSISNFHVLLLQTETRIADWREGALNGNYLKRKLQDAAEQLKQYEINATPKGWSCHWDRDHRRYFYVNEQSGESQWEFPDGEEEEEEGQALENRAEALPKQVLKEKTGSDTNSGESTENATGECFWINSMRGSLCKESFSGQVSSASLVPLTPFWTLLQSSVPVLQPPLPLEMPPPPPPPPESPPPPPPPPPGEDSEIQEVEMEDEEGEEPPAPGTEEDTPLKPPVRPAVISSQSSADSVTSSSPSAKAVKRKATEMSSGALQRSATIGSCPVLYSQPTITAGPQTTGIGPQTTGIVSQARALGLQSSYLGLAATPALMNYAECPVSVGVTAPTLQPVSARSTLPAPSVIDPPQPPQPPQPPPPPPPPPSTPKMPPPEKPKKGKKDKGKKSKTKMPSLVKKWQSIQRELDEEENSSSSDEDRELTSQKRIEEWKQQQLVSGLAERNANFEALPEDWRARLKRRKTAPNT